MLCELESKIAIHHIRLGKWEKNVYRYSFLLLSKYRRSFISYLKFWYMMWLTETASNCPLHNVTRTGYCYKWPSRGQGVLGVNRICFKWCFRIWRTKIQYRLIVMLRKHYYLHVYSSIYLLPSQDGSNFPKCQRLIKLFTSRITYHITFLHEFLQGMLKECVDKSNSRIHIFHITNK